MHDQQRYQVLPLNSGCGARDAVFDIRMFLVAAGTVIAEVIKRRILTSANILRPASD